MKADGLRELDCELFTDRDADVQAQLRLEPDFREGYDAFVEKRAPRFTGAPE